MKLFIYIDHPCFDYGRMHVCIQTHIRIQICNFTCIHIHICVVVHAFAL